MTIPELEKAPESGSTPAQDSLPNSEPTKIENGVKPAFRPMKIIGKMDLFKNYSSTSGYAWNLVKKENHSTLNDSDFEGERELNQAKPGLDPQVDLHQGTNASSPRGSRKSTGRVLKQKEAFDDFQNKSWMQS
jgi:hypothetical protein